MVETRATSNEFMVGICDKTYLSMMVLLRNAASSQTASLSSELSQHDVTKQQNKRSMARIAVQKTPCCHNMVITWMCTPLQLLGPRDWSFE